jgi:deoxyribonuclease-1
MAVNTLNTFFYTILVILTLFQVVRSPLVLASPDKLISFSRAKTILAKQIYEKKGRTFYCNCAYQTKSIVGKSCKLQTSKYKKRKKRLEWEHIVPAHAFGQSFKEWRESKKVCPKGKSPRKCARSKNLLFKEMEGNLHNLVPSVGAINALRSNYSFSEFDLAKSEKLCDQGFHLLKRKVNPPDSVKGDIARIYFYMDKKYPGRGIISNKNRNLYEVWNKLDPVSKKECDLSRLKALYQGDKNLFVEKHCKDNK